MTRRDSPTRIERLANTVDDSGVKFRNVVIPRDYQFVASANPQVRTEPLGDGRWFVTCPEDEVAEMVVATIEQIDSGYGRISDRRYALLRALVSDDEWKQAEGMVAVARQMAGGQS